MKHNRKLIYLAGFIFSLSVALMAYINSSFLSTFVDEKLVGMIYSLGSIFLIFALLLVPKVFNKMGGYKFLLLVTTLDILSILVFLLSENTIAIITAFVFAFTLNTVIIFSLDEFLEIFSKNSKTGGIRGAYLTMTSLAWVTSQLVLTFSKSKEDFSFGNIYLIAFFIMVSFLILSLFSFRNVSEPKYDNIKTIKFVSRFFKNKNLSRSFSINFLLQFFYSWMIIYTPIYLSAHLGFDWKEIGIIFSIMLLPFVIFPFQLGKYSDKIGERTMLIIGFAIASLATFSLFFIESSEIWVWAFALFMTRVGAATIETMSECYFFKHIKPENEEFVGVYRSASPVAYVIGPLSASLVFLFIPSFNFIYILLGILMLSGVYISASIKKNDL